MESATLHTTVRRMCAVCRLYNTIGHLVVAEIIVRTQIMNLNTAEPYLYSIAPCIVCDTVSTGLGSGWVVVTGMWTGQRNSYCTVTVKL